MPEEDFMADSELCDTCRQNRAIRHWTDAEQPGVLIKRQVCAMCLGLDAVTKV